MKQIKDKIIRYTDNDFIIEIVDSEAEFEAWIGNSQYGILSQMFAIPKKQTDRTITYEEFHDIVVSNLAKYKTIYRQEYMD